MIQPLRRSLLRRPGPALAFCALAVLATGIRPPSASASPAAGVPFAWGYALRGQLGNGTTSATFVTTPDVVANLSNVVAVSSGGLFTLALKPDGTVWDWGANEYGQLGDGTFVDRSTPIKVPNLAGVVA